MIELQAVATALHWLAVAVYTGSLVFLTLIFQRVYERYRAYKYVDNFRSEILQIYWRMLNLAFLFILLSGALLAGMRGKSVVTGLYGLVFSSKLALWLVQIFLTQEYLKPFSFEPGGNEQRVQTISQQARRYAILALLFLIPVAGFTLKYL